MFTGVSETGLGVLPSGNDPAKLYNTAAVAVEDRAKSADGTAALNRSET